MTATSDVLSSVESECTVRTTPLGGSALSQFLQRDAFNSHNWFTASPRSVSGWMKRLQNVQQEFAQQDWFAALSPAFAATGEAARRLSRAAAGGVVVTTGQQPGLFGGPSYTWSKAISALAFADELEEQTGVPVAPVFWAATDDADWLEAAVTFVVGANGLDELRLVSEPTEGIAMAEVRLGELRDALERLRDASGSAANVRVLELVADAYVPHATIGDAYVQLLRSVLEPLGIAVLDAAHPTLRIAADPTLRRALAESPAIAAALAQRTADIVAAGYTPQVEAIDTLSLVFRTTINRTGTATRERVPVDASMRTVREAEPGTLGSNVLLRPVLERALLPTVAYHAGPGELAYFAQVSAVSQALALSAPVAVPRWSGEVVERATMRALDRLGLDEADIALPHEAEILVARGALEEQVADSLERLRLAVETQIRALGEALASADQLVSAEVIAGLQRDIDWRVARMERRIVAATKKRESALMRDVAVVRAALRPRGKSPERMLNFLPYLAKYGKQLLEQMQQQARVHARALVRGSEHSS